MTCLTATPCLEMIYYPQPFSKLFYRLRTNAPRPAGRPLRDGRRVTQHECIFAPQRVVKSIRYLFLVSVCLLRIKVIKGKEFFTVKIISFEIIAKSFAQYSIQVLSGDASYICTHRYSEFDRLRNEYVFDGVI